MTRQTHLRATILILPITAITDASDAKMGNIGKGIRDDEGSGSGFTSGLCVSSCFELSVDRVN